MDIAILTLRCKQAGIATNDNIGILVIHSMGKQKPNFSDALKSEVRNRLGKSADRFLWEEIYWDDALEEWKPDLWTRMEAAEEPDGSEIPLDWKRIRNFVSHNFGEALSYHRSALNPLPNSLPLCITGFPYLLLITSMQNRSLVRDRNGS